MPLLNESPENQEEILNVAEGAKEKYFLDWSVDHVVTPKGEKLDFYDHRYLVDIYNDTSKDIRVKKAAQIGISTYAINKSMWFADTKDVSIIYTMPTASDVSGAHCYWRY